MDIGPKWCVVVLWQLPCHLCISLLPSWRGSHSLKRFPSAGDSDFRAICCGCATYLVTVVGDVWLVLSRSWPLAHFLPGGHSDSRVKFIWYPWISATWKCQVSGIIPLSFDTLVSVMTPLRPYWPLVHLDRPHTHDWYLASHPNRKLFSPRLHIIFPSSSNSASGHTHSPQVLWNLCSYSWLILLCKLWITLWNHFIKLLE